MEPEHISHISDVEAEAGLDSVVGDLSAETIEENDVRVMIARAEELKREGNDLLSLQSRILKLQAIDASAKSVDCPYDGKCTADSRSVFVGNIDYTATECDLRDHFSDSGTIRRVTIVRNLLKWQPKVHAYIEFSAEESVENAKTLNDSLFKGRQINVVSKRTNIPRPGTAKVFSSGYRRGSRGFRGRGSSSGAGYVKARPRSHFVYRRINPYQKQKI